MPTREKPPRGRGRPPRERTDPPAMDRPIEVDAKIEGTPAASNVVEADFSRLSIALTPDGQIAWDRMRPSTQETIRKLIGGGGATAAPASKMNAGTSRVLVGALVGSLSTLSIGVARMTGHTVESSEGMRLTDREQMELIPLWQAALDDYAVTLGRHENLIIAACATGLMLLPRMQALERIKKAKPGEVRPPLLDLAESKTEVN